MKLLDKGIIFSISIFIFSFAFWGVASAQGDLDGDGIPDSEDPETIVSANDTLEAGEYTFENLIITNNSVLTLNSSDTIGGFQGVKINAENLTIDQGASISGDGKGYGSDSGPGAGAEGAGGSYGGVGGYNTVGSVYGSITAPSDLGSGGGHTSNAAGGAGGGAIRLTVNGTLTVNGSMTANGNDGGKRCGYVYCYYGAGGSGGSIWVLAGELTGTGIISANGGNRAGGGGGGRIAIYYDASTYNGSISSHGGSEAGGAGTTYLKSAGRRAKANHNGTFVWADNTEADFASTGEKQFLIRASGGVGVGTSSPTEQLDVNGTARLRGISDGTGTIVVVDADGKLWKQSPGNFYKENIRRLGTDPDKVFQLESVKFDWKTTGVEDIGLIAEDVEKAIPDLVVYDSEGRPHGVRYDRVALYLLEAVKLQQERISALEKEISELKD